MSESATEISRAEIERELDRIDRELVSRLPRVKQNADSLKRKLAAVEVNLATIGQYVAEAYEAQKSKKPHEQNKLITALDHFLHRSERAMKFKPSEMAPEIREKIDVLLGRSNDILADCRQYAVDVEKATKNNHQAGSHKLSMMCLDELSAHLEMTKRRVENLGLASEVALVLILKKIDWDLSGLKLSINALRCANLSVVTLANLIQKLADGDAGAMLSLRERQQFLQMAQKEPKALLQAKA